MPRKPAAPDADEGAIVNLASTSGIEDKPTVEDLLAQVEALKAELGVKDVELADASKRALAAAEAQAGFQQSGIQAVPSGRKVTAMRLDPEHPYETKGYKEDGRPILKPNFVKTKVDTWFLKIDIPPMAGWDMKINGMPIVHGATYEVDLGVLQYLNDMIYKAWQHEAVINGKNENVFRKPQEKRIGSRA
jgi:hypothetical protein